MVVWSWQDYAREAIDVGKRIAESLEKLVGILEHPKKHWMKNV